MISLRNILLPLLLVVAHNLWAQQSVGVVFYDVERFYDTLTSSFYDDSDYTPSGRKQWTDERYDHKLQQIARVIDTMQMPIVVLYGVESQQVVRDIQRTSQRDYSAVHRSLDYYDGLDFALLYYADMLQISSVTGGRADCCIRGELLGWRISLHLTRRGDRLYSVTPPDGMPQDDITIAWGRLDRGDIKRLDMQDPLRRVERMGAGDTRSSDYWYLKHRIGVRYADDIEMTHSGVYINAFLLSADRSRPLGTYSLDSYWGGYSNHLPQFIMFEL